MRSKSIELKKQIYDFVNDWRRTTGKTPTIRCIADGLSIAKTTAQRYLVEMSEEDWGLSYSSKGIETREMNSHNTMLSKAMIVGSIPCGEATSEEQFVEEYVNLPVSIFGKGEFYILHARGDSMEDAGINEGDMIVIRKQVTANEGDIIVALDDENKNTLKRFGGFNEHGEAVLEYMNEAVYPGRTITVRELTVQGVAQHVIKSL